MSEREQRTTRVIPPADLVEMLEATLATTPGPRRRSIGRRARRMAMRGVTVVQLFALVFMLMVPLGTSASDSTTATEAAPSEAPAPTADATPEPTAETTPDPTPAPTAVPAPTTEPEPAATTEPEPASTPAPTTEPSAASDPTTEPSAPTETPIDPEPSAPTETPIDPEPSALPSLEPSAMPSGSAPAESPATTVLDPPGPPTIASDQADYPPAATVTLTGENWAPGEQVHIYVNDTVGSSWSRNIDVVASPTGTIVDAFELPTWFVAKYNVVATGAISGTATTTFTDLSVGLYDQCSNDDGDGFASGDTGCRWVNGNLQANNSTYHEGDSTVQRLWLTSFVPGSSHTVSLTYGTTKGAKHAYDFLTTWDWSEDWITLADRCQSIDGCAAAGESTVNMADDPNVPNTIETGLGSASRRFVMRGGTLNAATAPALTSGIYGSGDTETTVTVTFTVDGSGSMCETKGHSTTCAVALFFGAHVARSSAWIPVDGQGGATSIPGSPYHVALAAVDGASAGSRDNQMQAGALGGTIVIIKDADPDGPQDFNFTLTGQPGFSLDDDADPTLPASMSFQVPAGTYSAVELAPPTGWSLFALTCVDPTTNTTLSLATRTASINLGSGETVTCTFTNTLQRGSITIIKDTVPNGPTDFAYTTSGAGLSSFSLDDDADVTLSNTKVFNDLVPGSYSVTETLPVSGFDLTGLSCVDSGTGTSSNVTLATGLSSITLGAGGSVTCTYVNTQRGSITIIKDTVPNGPTDFAYTTSGAGLSSFSLDDDADVTLSNTKVFNDLVPGSYSVTETLPVSGFDLTGLSCVDSGTGTSSNVTLATGLSSITLGAGGSVTCTYVNTQRGSITIIKDTVPNGPTDFAYTTSGAGLSSFSLDDDADVTLSNTKVFNDLVPGSYSVTETLPVSGFDLTGLSCVDSGTGTSSNVTLATGLSSITLGAGGSVTCTYVNTQRGSITIIKDTVPNGPTDFAYTTSGAGLSSFSLDDDADVTLSNTKVFNDLVPGSYSVTETLPVSGFDLTGLSCVDSGTGTSSNVTLATGLSSITLGAGGSVTCTYVNTQRGSITIIKDTVPNGPTDFAYTTSGAGLSSFSLDDDADVTLSNTKVFNDLVPGSYSVTETLPVSGFDLTGLSCVDSGTGTSSNVTLATGLSSITLGAGGSVTCTYVNTQRGSITIIKDTVPNGPTDFAYTTSGAGLSSFSLDDDADVTLSNTKVFNDLVPGSYSVTETLPVSGFDLTGLSCVDSGTGTSSNVTLATGLSSITLGAGGSVTCTYVNTQRGSITIIKDTVPNGPTDFAYTTSGAGLSSFSLDDDADVTLSNTKVFNDLVPGSYSVTETLPVSGFDLTGLSCVDSGTGTSSNVTLATGLSSITLGAGGSVTCTYVNTQRGSITIIKDTVPNGPTDFAYTTSGAGLSSFSLDDDADVTLSNTKVFNDLVPGSYSVTETLPVSGFDLTGLSCVDSGTGTSSNVTLATGLSSITLGAGGSVTCTYVNTQRGSITIIKDTVPNGPTDFAYTTSGAGLSSFSLDDDADVTLSNTKVFNDLVPGSYSVTETLPVSGFDLTGLSCVDSGTGTSSNVTLATGLSSITLGAGGSVTCTYVNTQRGSITIIKDTVPNGPTDFAYTTSGAGLSSFSLDDDADVTLSNTKVFNDLVPGSYSVTETLPVSGFDLTGLSCVDSGTGTSSNVTLATGLSSITLGAGGSVTCTYVNTQRGKVQVIKTQSGVTPPTGATFTFELRTGVTPDAVNPAPPPAPAVIPGDPGTLLETLIANDGNGFTLDFAATLIPGDTYQLCEVQPAVGWTIDFLGYAEYTLSIGGENTRVCIDFTVSAGETKSITVDNVPPPGGNARTIGYWKNWTSCDGHGNQDPVLDTTLALSPDDFDVDGRTGIRIGDLDVDTCAIAVDLLDKREIKNPALVGDGKKKASDPAFNLVAQLLAYRLNILAGSGDLPCANTAAAQAQAHLDALDFNGNTHGPISKSLGQTLNVLARILDEYNNNVLVCGP